jgi:hypothetical protein
LNTRFRSLIVAALLISFSNLGAIPQAAANVAVPCSVSGSFSVSNNEVVSGSGASCVGEAVIPEGVTQIQSNAFSSAAGLTSIQLPNSLTSIGVAAITGSGITSITFPPSVLYIGQQAFQGNANLRNVTISGNPETATAFGFYAFNENSLDTLTIGVGNGKVTLENQSGVLAGLVRASTITLGAGLVSAGTGLSQSTVVERVNDFTSIDLTGSRFDLYIPRFVADPAFTLSSSSETSTADSPATGFTVNSTGGAITRFAISATPPGMSFNTTTGAFTGTPTIAAPATDYTITGFNRASETATQTFTLTVRAVETPAFTLSSSSESRLVNTAATGFTINSTGDAIRSFAINDTPTGMSFDTTTGALTGTPTIAAPPLSTQSRQRMPQALPHKHLH